MGENDPLWGILWYPKLRVLATLLEVLQHRCLLALLAQIPLPLFNGCLGGLRVQASCMGMGQAAGAAAALAFRDQTTPLEVPLAKIHELLREHGAIIPG